MEIIPPSKNNPIRQYVPKKIYSHYEDSTYKPGFNKMYKEFKSFVINNCKPTKNSVGIEEAKKTLDSC